MALTAAGFPFSVSFTSSCDEGSGNNQLAVSTDDYASYCWIRWDGSHHVFWTGGGGNAVGSSEIDSLDYCDLTNKDWIYVFYDGGVKVVLNGVVIFDIVNPAMTTSNGVYNEYPAGATLTQGDLSLGNTDPDTPTNTTPTDASTDVSRNPTLTASAFSDDDEGDTHAGSQWQIATDSGFSSVVWDSGDNANLTSIEVNATNGTFAGVLAGKTKLGGSITYYWRVRYKDNNGGWSDYSTGTDFETTAPTVNKNGVWVEHLAKFPVKVAKPMTIGVVEEVPTFTANDGTTVLCTANDTVYVRSNGAWVVSSGGGNSYFPSGW